MKPQICIALPIKSGKIEDLKKDLEKVRDLNPNFIELRFDYIKKLSELNEEFINSLLSYIRPPIPVIFTLRKFSEGGNTQIEEIDRYRIIEELLDFKPQYIDIEMSTEDEILSKIISKCVDYEIGIIFSHHDFQKTPRLADCLRIIEDFRKRIKKDLKFDLKIVEKNVLKLIFTAQSVEDCLIPLQICAHLSNKKQKIISFCMGDLGILSRVLCISSGSYFTFASIEEGTASGQIKIEPLRKFYDFFL